MSLLNTIAPNPNIVSFAIYIAFSILLYLNKLNTGPKIY